MYTPDEVAEIIANCEERLIKDKIITEPFTAVEIQGGILKKYLTEEDYMSPHQVITCICTHIFRDTFMSS